MSSAPALSDEKEKELLRRCWYSHDARWYMAVAQEFGVEAANRLNKRVCQALGKAEMRRLVKALGIGAPTTVQELVQVIEAGFRFFVPPPLTQAEFRAVDDHSYEGWMKRCFIHDNITKAGIGSFYICAALDRIQGWHEALGVPMVEEPPARLCPKVQGGECRLLIAFQPLEA
ncbi:MAG: DUF6125 family protein [Dehalococcoidia bacterium]|nr:DUF6125 family protein [Dehalococcoidia bacterium]